MSSPRLPEFWIVAGPNGAGKTTCVQKEPIASLLPQVQFLNPDDRTLRKLKAAGYQGFSDSLPAVQSKMCIESANEVFAELEAMIDLGEQVGVETMLSSGKYQSLVEKVVARQGFVGLLYVALASPTIALERVAARVKKGGHGVPDAKVVQRWRRSLDCLSWFTECASAFWVIDNSDSEPSVAPALIASGRAGKLQHLVSDAFPEMIDALSKLPR